MKELNFIIGIVIGIRDIKDAESSITQIQIGTQNAICEAVYVDILTLGVIIDSSTTEHESYEGGRIFIVAPAPPDETWEFKQWTVVSGDVSIDDYYSSQTYVTMNTTDAKVTPEFQKKPTFTVIMKNGTLLCIDKYTETEEWVESAELVRGSNNTIKMNPAPTGKQFLQWNVYVNNELQTNANDVLEPFAETTQLRNLIRNITIEAVYYTPNPDVKYTLTIKRKDGTLDQGQYTAGSDVTISASYPDDGMKFYKWTGDTTYIAGGIYREENYVHMPAQSISIEETYIAEGYLPEYEVVMTDIYGECAYTTSYEDPETGEITEDEYWTTKYAFPEGTEVKIRASGFDAEYYFATWIAFKHDTEEDANSLITNLQSVETTITVPDYDVDIQAKIALRDTFFLNIIDGATSGYYYENARADIYFNKEDTDNIHYKFARWYDYEDGDTVSQLELYDGGMFDVTDPGTKDDPQYIKMPGKTTTIYAAYTTLYKLTLENGTIDATNLNEGFYEENTTLNITADPAPEGMKFQYWSGDTDKLANKYDPTTTITTTVGTTTLKAIYSTETYQNNIGYVNINLTSVTEITNDTISIIAGEIKIGFIIIDSIGHIYVITNIDEITHTSTIYKMTKTT